MWPTANSRSGFAASIIVVSAVLVLLASQPSSPAEPRVPHSRIKRMVPRTTALAHSEPARAGTLNHGSDVLVRLQDGQTTLTKQTADFSAAVQRRLSELSAQLGESQRERQLVLEQTNRRLGSTERLLKFVVALQVVLLGGLVYLASQLPQLQDKSFKWKGKIPEPDAVEEGIVSWSTGESADGPVRKPGIIKDTHLPSAPR